MTRPDTRHRDDGTSERPKATLYCWECDHASPVDGDWVRQSQGRSVTYVCPDCETTIADRPQPDDDRADRFQPLTAWAQVVRTVMNVWRAGVAGVAAAARYR